MWGRVPSGWWMRALLLLRVLVCHLTKPIDYSTCISISLGFPVFPKQGIPNAFPLLAIKQQSMQNNKATNLSLIASRIASLVNRNGYKRVVLQMGKDMLTSSFQLTAMLRKDYPDTQCFVLYDSLKQSCCTDVLGADHVHYDCLVHFGPACFSEPYLPNHHYIFDQPDADTTEKMLEILAKQGIFDEMHSKGIGYLMVQQKYYQLVKEAVFANGRIGPHGIQLLTLPFDREGTEEYLVFGYYGQTKQKGKHVLVVSEEQEEGTEQMSFAQQLSFALKGLANKLGQQLFTLDLPSKAILPLTLNNNKLLMQRYSLISQLDNYTVFGLIVSNTSTAFFQNIVEQSRRLLSRHGKKSFVFMMNNLNEVKLGNFPEIEVYVIVSCYNHSLFGIKDFHRLVVTPNDLQVAFQDRPFDSYTFDCAAVEQGETAEEEKEDEQEEKVKIEQDAGGQEEAGGQLAKVSPCELALQQKIQTLDLYRDKQFKGLTFTEKKEVKKMTKGKIGLAQSYTQLE